MPEYDAFGRKTGENPLEQPSAQPEPVPAPPPATPRSRTLPVGVVVAVVVVLVSMGSALALLAGGSEEGGGLTQPVVVEDAPTAPSESPGTTPPGSTSEPPGEAPAPAQPPDGTDPPSGSLLDRSRLAHAIQAMRVAELGRPVSVRVSADRVDAQLVTSKGLLRSVQVGVTGEPRELNATQAGPVPSMPWTAVDPAAPQRLMRAAAEREDRPLADVDYLVLLDLGEPTWGLFFKGGRHYQGDASGKLLRRVS